MPIPGSVAVPSAALTASEIIQLASDPAKYAKIVSALDGREAELDARERRLAARETSVEVREEAAKQAIEEAARIKAQYETRAATLQAAIKQARGD